MTSQARKPRVYWGRIAYKLFLHAGAGFVVYLLVTRGLSVFPLIAWMLFAVLSLATGFGVTVNLHRLMTHRSFICRSTTLRWALMGSAAMAGQGPEAAWVPVHELHHRNSDTPGDPHTPLRFYPMVTDPETGKPCYDMTIPRRSRFWRMCLGLLWAHAGWALVPASEETAHAIAEIRKEFLDDTRPGLTPEQRRDIRIAQWQNNARTYLALLFIPGFLIPGFIGGTVVGITNGAGAVLAAAGSSILLAGFFRIVIVYHITSSVNSIGHLIGESPRYACNCPYVKTNARNTRNPLMAIISIGERNHGNHHFMPRSAYFAQWLDPGKWLLVLCEKLGLVAEVKKPQMRYCEVHRRMRTVVDA